MIIGLHGRAGSGKSTAFELLRANSNGKAVALAKFAAPIYQLMGQAYRIIAPAYTPPADFVKDRKFLQWIGTEWARSIKPSVWVDLWKARVELLKSKDTEVIIVSDDCRYSNEAEMIQSIGGVVVRITSKREGFVVGGIDGHESETSLDDKHVNYTITNDGTVEEFQAALKVLFAQIEIDLAKPVVEEPVLEEDDFLPMT